MVVPVCRNPSDLKQTVVPGKSKEYAGLGSFPFCPGGMFHFFHKTRIIYGQHTGGLCHLFGKQFLVNIQEGLFLKRRAREEVLEGPDIFGTRKMEGDWFNGFSFQWA